MMNLEKKTALVIGGTHGMGAATASLLRDHGAAVTVTGSNLANLDAARAAGFGTIQLDLSRSEHLLELPRLTADRLDAVFLFAGIAELQPLTEVDEATFDRMMAINARGAFFALQALLPRLVEGSSITIATVTPSTATPGMGVYMASKGALRGWAQVLAAELLLRNIRVNMVAPGFIDTPTLGMASLSPTERLEMHAIGDAVTPMHRHGSMREVAEAALFLAFQATFTTGVELPVDGGISTVDAS
jgi:NAD(P)-dependent dehydrogenase (short-subunit alcohol dehydrogenase family)